MADLSDLNEGIEHEEEEKDPDRELTDAREALPFLLGAPMGVVAKHVKDRWERHEKQARQIQAELKVNHLRYSGVPFAQVHPNDPTDTYVPRGARQRLPPSINKIRRAVHRYMAQVTADEPIIEGVPADHSDDARDAAEASTAALRGEWHRMHLHRRLQRAVHFSNIYRSGFWFFDYDVRAGGKVKAEKFREDPETGERVLQFVNSAGEFVDDPEEAADIWQGDITCEVMNPMNVRWSGSDYAHEADELMVGKILTLRQAYEMEPKLREVKISKLVAGTPPRAEEWLNDIRGAGGTASRKPQFDDEDIDVDGRGVDDGDSILDASVMLIHYFRKPGRQYENGVHALLVGEHLIHRGPLRYGVMPIAHFKTIDDPSDPLGFGVVDMLKDPQELLDFVNGQVLRWLQTLKRRWFVPVGSNVNARDLLSETRSIISYHPNGGAPTPETPGELPQSLGDWVDRFGEAFDDEMGIHDTMQGKHVPGVSSGRHAEALRSGDETVLGLTRTQIQVGLEAAGRIILEMVKKEWTVERRVSYFDGREYLDAAFSATDFGSTSQVRLKRGTLLMLTPAQKLETLFGYVEMGALSVAELRRLAPISDTAGISVTEDPHYKRARRQNALFLSGPPEALRQARDEYEAAMQSVEGDLQFIQRAAALGAVGTPDAAQDAQVAQQAAMRIAQEAELAWQQALQQYGPTSRAWEHQNVEVAQSHALEHMQALASEKVARLPPWWVDHFEQHTLEHLQAVQAMTQPAPEASQA